MAFVGVDAPPGDNFQIMPPIDAVTNPQIAYLRAHGRNTEGYLTGQIGGRALRLAVHGRRAGRRSRSARRTLAESAGQVHVAFNNNRGDDAPTAAQRFRALLGQEIPEPDRPRRIPS